jgi:hypothetical protein
MSDLDSHHLATLPPPSTATRSEENDAKNSKEAKGANEAVALSGPAPALSYLQVAFVGSSNVSGFWETIAPSQFSTVQDHGGVQLRVVTDELGYGNARVALFNGAVLPASANYQTQSFCWNGSQYTTACTPGQIIYGFRRYWNLDGRQGGSFYYQNTSTNSPFNTLSDTISIR